MKLMIHDRGPELDSCFRTVTMTKTYSAGLHYNTEYELIHIIEGSGTRFVGDDIRPFEAPDIVFLAPQVPHSWHNPSHPLSRAPKNPIAIMALFKEEFLGREFLGVPEMARVRQLLKASARGLQVGVKTQNRIATRMHDLVSAKGTDRLLILLEIICTLASSCDLRPIASIGYRSQLTEERTQRVAAIQKYVLEHYTEPIGRDQIARLVHMNSSSLSRFFARVTNRPLVEFINEVRVAEACRRLAGSDDDIMSIAFDCGFSNLSHFNRQFRRFKKMSPREYREQSLKAQGV